MSTSRYSGTRCGGAIEGWRHRARHPGWRQLERAEQIDRRGAVEAAHHHEVRGRRPVMRLVERRDVCRRDALQRCCGSQRCPAIGCRAEECASEFLVSDGACRSTPPLALGDPLLPHAGHCKLREPGMARHVDEQVGAGSEVGGEYLQIEERRVPVGARDQVGAEVIELVADARGTAPSGPCSRQVRDERGQPRARRGIPFETRIADPVQPDERHRVVFGKNHSQPVGQRCHGDGQRRRGPRVVRRRRGRRGNASA